MSLVAQMQRDRRSGEVSESSDDLPLFAAAEAIAASKRKRGTLLVLLPAVLVPLVLILAPVLVSQQFSGQAELPFADAGTTFSGRVVRQPRGDEVVRKDANTSRATFAQISPASSVEGAQSIQGIQSADVAENVETQKNVAAPNATVPKPAIVASQVQQAAPVLPSKNKPVQGRVEVAAKMQAGKPHVETLQARVSESSRASINQANNNAILDFKRISKVSAAQRDQLLLGKASELLQQGATALAIQALESEVAASNELPQSAALLASLWTGAKEFTAASNLLALYENAGRHHSALTVAGIRLELAKANYPAVLKTVAGLSPALAERTDIMEMQAVALHSSGDFVAASYVYRNLVRRDDTNPRWWMGMAIALDAAAERDAARQAYSHALELRGLGAKLGEYARQRLANL
ncbi:MAG: hypothetical protein KJP25_05615 [Gammaproteobacteria bacterium]|nr:hypothetical protein [Gammaproteobacteria bacterium]NND39976.1 hypothetical protein [Pseudomonadales bacterium]NNM10995.1 hypothetical protein [Pseudomonadales bacterium]